jgi:hypothetical protein
VYYHTLCLVIVACFITFWGTLTLYLRGCLRYFIFRFDLHLCITCIVYTIFSSPISTSRRELSDSVEINFNFQHRSKILDHSTCGFQKYLLFFRSSANFSPFLPAPTIRYARTPGMFIVPRSFNATREWRRASAF